MMTFKWFNTINIANGCGWLVNVNNIADSSENMWI